MDVSKREVNFKRVVELRFEDGTDIADAVDHALTYSFYETRTIVKWTHNGIDMECCWGDNRKAVMDIYHSKRRARDNSDNAARALGWK